MENLISKAQREFTVFKTNPDNYSQKVKAISSSFGLQNPMHLRHRELPNYWAGNIPPGNEKIAVVELNRKYDEVRSSFENQFKTESWEGYSFFQNNIFSFYKNKSTLSCTYCESMAASFSNKIFKNRTHFDFLQENILRLDILPYSSVDFDKCNPTPSIESYLFSRFEEDILPFLSKNKNIKKAIFHNKKLTQILLKKNFISPDNIIYIRMNKGSKNDFIYKKNLRGTEFYIFSRYIPYGGFARTEVYNNIFG